MSGGYVKIFRKVLENPNASNPLFLAVWSYILLKASHKPYVMRIAGQDRELEAGDLVCSCRKIAEYFSINKDTANNILNTMENASMIRRTLYARKTVISVLKWSSYQSGPDALPDTPPDTSWDTLPDTNKKKEDRRKNIIGDDDGKPDLLSASREILSEFNGKAGKSYKLTANSPHIKTIKARLKEGFKKEEMLEIIEHKVAELKDTENEMWLNPETLFRPKNIERNLEFARKSEQIEEKRLWSEYNRLKRTSPVEAEEIKQKIKAMKEKNAGQPV